MNIFRNHYFGEADITLDNIDILIRMISDQYKTEAARAARFLAPHVPLYMYMFTHKEIRDNELDDGRARIEFFLIS